MHEEHPNITILKRFNPANVETISAVLAEDAVFHFFNPKLPDIQGDYKGFNGFKMFFEKMAKRTNGAFGVNPISATPVGDELVVVHSRNTINFENQLLEIDAVIVWRIVDGKIKEVWDIPAVYT